MFKDKEVLVSVNSRNIKYYRNIGYEISISGINEKKELLVMTSDIPKSSHHKISAICEICKSESIISVHKYYVNFERNGKGFYSCFKCKNIEKEKTLKTG